MPLINRFFLPLNAPTLAIRFFAHCRYYGDSEVGVEGEEEIEIEEEVEGEMLGENGRKIVASLTNNANIRLLRLPLFASLIAEEGEVIGGGLGEKMNRPK